MATGQAEVVDVVWETLMWVEEAWEAEAPGLGAKSRWGHSVTSRLFVD
jgi:hypothetical protein